MPATKVPCPRPSPGELPGSVVRLTSATTRPPKSGRNASMPESTIAIVAAGAAGLTPVDQYLATPVTYGHFSLLEFAERRIGASGVIALTRLSAASVRICPPVSCTARPSIERRPRTPFLSPARSASACAAWLPAFPCTMTAKVSPECALAASSRLGVTNESLTVFPEPTPAAAPRGSTKARASVVSNAVRRLLPQSALPREPLSRLLPQSALARSSARQPPVLIPLPLKPAVTGRNVESQRMRDVTLLRYAAQIPSTEGSNASDSLPLVRAPLPLAA